MAKARRTPAPEQTSSDAAAVGMLGAPAPDDRDERANGQPQDRIAARAYELYLARGGGDGRDWDDWLAAERELSSDTPPGERHE